ncbi:MAG: 5-(carboxyamino)imidazole ribonucleotide mutase [Nitrospirae bacterium]|nr:MAG: 5-(carboxyamino)imidazole ribonucleotide mutase [Nitrospirota bacterium]
MNVDVVVLMGSASDLPIMREATRVLDRLGLTWRAHVTSAHRTPERTVELVRRAEEEGARAIICGAGMAAHLAGVVAAHTLLPVLGVPLPGGVMDGMDALLATVQMPAGVPVATFSVGKAGARNAAFFAARLVARDRAEVRAALEAARASDRQAVEEADADVRTELGGEP